MLIAEYDYDLDIEVQREEAYESGLEDGKEIGEVKGRDRVNKLNVRLIADKRFEDLEKSVNDMEYQEKLLKEYGI